MIRIVNNKKYLLSLIFIIVTQNLFANAGSPMLMFSFFHLILVNALIGYFESRILSRLSIDNKIGWIIIANYISMFFGMYFIAPYFTELIGYEDFFGNNTYYGYYNLNMFFIGMTISFIASLIIEFPFYYFGISKTKRNQTFKGLLIANVITNILMTSIYYLYIKDGGHF